MTKPSTSSRPAFNWLLAVLLLTGIFAFNGYQGNSPTTASRPFQTELVFTGNPGETRPASLTIILDSNSLFKAAPVYSDRLNGILNYSSLIKVKTDNLSEQFRMIRTAFNFCSHRIPHNSEEEDYLLLTAV